MFTTFKIFYVQSINVPGQVLKLCVLNDNTLYIIGMSKQCTEQKWCAVMPNALSTTGKFY